MSSFLKEVPEGRKIFFTFGEYQPPPNTPSDMSEFLSVQPCQGRKTDWSSPPDKWDLGGLLTLSGEESQNFSKLDFENVFCIVGCNEKFKILIIFYLLNKLDGKRKDLCKGWEY